MMSLQPSRPWRVAEFFAGIGLAGLGMTRAGLNVVWSNDIAASKELIFKGNFGSLKDHEYLLQDLGSVQIEKLPKGADIAWASFPCTDLSLAGGRAGLHRGVASSTFWHFIKAISKLGSSRPKVIALENVTAFATSHSGRDIASAIQSLNGLGYSVDVVSIDARHFVPQSRPRIFLIGMLLDLDAAPQPSSELRPDWLTPLFEDTTLVTHRVPLPELPPKLVGGLESFLEPIDDDDPRWWVQDKVDAYVASLSKLQLKRFADLKTGPTIEFRTAYRRMRDHVPRWEMRDDAIAGCLRTATGGSSKQAVVALGKGEVRVRWMTPREYASLMGAPEYDIQGIAESKAYSGFGDAVCVPVVEWLSEHYLIPLLEGKWRPSGNEDLVPHSHLELESHV